MRSLVILLGLFSISAYATVPSVGTVGSVSPSGGWLAEEAAVRGARLTTTLQILDAIPQNLNDAKYDPTGGANPDEEFVPEAQGSLETLQAFDQAYWDRRAQEDAAGYVDTDPFTAIINELTNLFSPASGCYQLSCPVYAKISKQSQTLTLYVNGSQAASWPVSTAMKGYRTPNMNKTVTSRIYDRYSSRKYPGGSYMGLGNMPYAVFISGGYAIHGTTAGNWRKLGRPASHGCIRLHPEHAKAFNRMVRANGPSNVWVQVL